MCIVNMSKGGHREKNPPLAAFVKSYDLPVNNYTGADDAEERLYAIGGKAFTEMAARGSRIPTL